MVEMLGVLAIIGVLSIGGIAGYTYAMNKSKAEALNASAVAGSGDGDSCTLTASDCPNGIDTENCVCQSTEGQTCTDHTTNECGLGYYCRFRPSSCSASGTGTCKAVGSGIEVIPAGDPTKTYLESPSAMDWWSAYSWCKGNGMDLITGTIADIPLNSYHSTFDNPLYQYFGEGITCWTGHDYGDSCTARNVDAYFDIEYVDNDFRHVSDYALCQ